MWELPDPSLLSTLCLLTNCGFHCLLLPIAHHQTSLGLVWLSLCPVCYLSAFLRADRTALWTSCITLHYIMTSFLSITEIV